MGRSARTKQRLLALGIAVGLLCALTAPGSALVLIDNLSGNDAGGSSIVGTRIAAIGFQTPPDRLYRLDAVRLVLRGGIAGESELIVRLFDDDGLGPSQFVMELVGTELIAGGAPREYEFLPLPPIRVVPVLVPDTVYWIVVHNADPQSPASPTWSDSNPNVIPTGLASYVGVRFAFDGAPTPPPSDLAPDAVYKFAVDVTDLPEPSAAAAGAAAAATLQALRNRRRAAGKRAWRPSRPRPPRAA